MQILSLEDVDIDTPSKRQIEQVPFIEQRLMEYDWQAIIDRGEKFED